MKFNHMFLAAIAAATLALAGCSKSGVDTSSLEKSFKSADAAVQSSVDKAVTAIKSADYSGALSDLKSLALKAKLTPEQEQAIKDVMAQIEKVVAEAAQKVAGEAEKATKDLKSVLPK